MKYATGSEIAGRAVLLALTVMAVRLDAGLTWFMWALVAANTIQFVLSLAFARRLVAVSLDFDRRMWSKILKESWPMAVSIVFNLVYLKGDVIILSLFRSQSEVGLYGAAYKVLDVVTVIPTAFMGLVMPVIAGVWASGNRPDFARKMSRAFDFLTIVALPLAAGAFIVGNDLMSLVAGADFAEAGRLLSLLMIAGAMVFWSALFGYAVVAIGLQRLIMWFYGIDAALSLALYLIAIPRWGAVGAAWVTIFSETFIAIATAIVVGRRTQTWPKLGNAAKASLATAIMAAIVYVLPDWNVLLRIGIGALSYAALIIGTGTVDRATISRLLRRQPAV
jgi:O-antigen/teichoic acid export membrane protein